MPVFQLNEALVFPPPDLAREDGLLAVGGDLSIPRLLLAYQMGIFPWYSPHEPILWWAPDPRLVLFPDEFHLSQRLRRKIRQNLFEVTMDEAFAQVIRQCAHTRLQDNLGTWIDEEMIAAYCKLHELGYAHSVECWRQGELAGGLYGVSLGKTFFGESMFSKETDSSKIALAGLVSTLLARDYDMIDCQIATGHLMSLGAREISAAKFLGLLEQSLAHPTRRGKWTPVF